MGYAPNERISGITMLEKLILFVAAASAVNELAAESAVAYNGEFT
jgi:hypothetical protein